MSQQVGRVYLEDQSGYLGHVIYGVHPAFRAPEVRFEGRPFVQVRRLPEGCWVYRSTAAHTVGDSLDTLTGFVGVGGEGWIPPSDYVQAPNPAAVALAAFEKALADLKKHPEHADLVDYVTAEVRASERPDLIIDVFSEDDPA